MGFQFSDRSKELQLRITKFLDDHIYPAEEVYAQQMQEFTEQGDRWQIPQIIEDKKEIAKEEGLWNLFLPENPMGESMSNLAPSGSPTSGGSHLSLQFQNDKTSRGISKTSEWCFISGPGGIS